MGPCGVLGHPIRGNVEKTIVFLNISKGAWGSLEPPWGILGEPWGGIGGPWRVPGEALGGPRGCSGCLLGSLGVLRWPLCSHRGAYENIEELVVF